MLLPKATLQGNGIFSARIPICKKPSSAGECGEKALKKVLLHGLREVSPFHTAHFPFSHYDGRPNSGSSIQLPRNNLRMHLYHPQIIPGAQEPRCRVSCRPAPEALLGVRAKPSEK
jgi:hypothetical protein